MSSLLSSSKWHEETSPGGAVESREGGVPAGTRERLLRYAGLTLFLTVLGAYYQVLAVYGDRVGEKGLSQILVAPAACYLLAGLIACAWWVCQRRQGGRWPGVEVKSGEARNPIRPAKVSGVRFQGTSDI
ncbi:MAG: hypothetical protein HYU36_00980 [Planctomycetes bacterium]|nr:hypothetical protein [Planctomycetota bacterium]